MALSNSQPLPSGWSNYGPIPTIFTPPASCNYLTTSNPPTSTLTLTITPTSTLSNPTNTPTLSTTTLFPTIFLYDPILNPSCYPSQYPRATTKTISLPITSPTQITTSPDSLPTSMYFYPGRCPSGWDVHTLWMSYLPAGYTMAQCCPSYPTSTSTSSKATITSSKATSTSKTTKTTAAPTLTKRRGKNGSGKKPQTTNTECGFALPTPNVYPNYINPDITIKDFASGNLSTLSLESVFAIRKYVSSTGITVLWKTGDFPDLDVIASASASVSSSAAAAASSAASSAYNKSKNGATSYKQPPNIGLIVGLTLMGVVLAALFVWTWWEGKFKPRMIGDRGKDTKTYAFFKRKFGSGGARGSGGDGNEGVVSKEVVVVNGRTVPGWFVRWMRKTIVGGDASRAGTQGGNEGRRSEEGLLVGNANATGEASSKYSASRPPSAQAQTTPSTHDTNPTAAEIEIENIPPPPYTAAVAPSGKVPSISPSTTENTPSSSSSSSAPTTRPQITLTTTTTVTTRTWNETPAEFTQRRADEQRVLFRESLRRERDERRAGREEGN